MSELPKTLDERAMEYAITKLGVRAERVEGLTDLAPKIPFEEWKASEMKHQMEKEFDVFAVQEAIKRAEEIVMMVIPKGDDSNATA